LPRYASWGAKLKRYGRLTVAKSIHSTITALDGYVANKDGDFD
jgi:hypothetical protein